jgi:hypothetical protein
LRLLLTGVFSLAALAFAQQSLTLLSISPSSTGSPGTMIELTVSGFPQGVAVSGLSVKLTPQAGRDCVCFEYITRDRRKQVNLLDRARLAGAKDR